MASSTLKNPNEMLYKKGDTFSGFISVWGYITTSGKQAIIIFNPDKLVSNVSGFTITSLTTALRGVGQAYVGGSSAYNPISDSTVSLSSYINGGDCQITLTKTSSFGLTNNTPFFGSITVSLTFT